MSSNTQILLSERPSGKLDPSHFTIRTGEVPAIADGQVLVRNVLLSIDAANRAWMQGATYKSAVEEGDVMHGDAIGEVVESRTDRWAAGDVVGGELGWQEYAALDGTQAGAGAGHVQLAAGPGAGPHGCHTIGLAAIGISNHYCVHSWS